MPNRHKTPWTLPRIGGRRVSQPPRPPGLPLADLFGSVVEEDELLQLLSLERTRLANALHDGPLSQLVLVRAALDEVGRGNAGALQAVVERLGHVTGQLHDLTGSLHEESLAERPLREAIEQIALALRGRVRVVLRVDPSADGYHDEILRHAARELLSNAVQHSGAATVTLTLSVLSDELHLQVTDDGTGVDPRGAARARAAGHLGLQRLERAAVRLGGGFSLVPDAPMGTIATLRLPIGALAPRQAASPPPAVLGEPPRSSSAQTILAAADAVDAACLARDLAALRRDHAAGARDDQADAQDAMDTLVDREAALKADELRERAAARRDRAASNRAAGAEDRREAAADREFAARTRRVAAADRALLAGWLAVAEIDALTGARTRAAGLHDLDLELARCRRGSGELVIAFVDVDGLKAVNDTRGHAAGDATLHRVVAVLKHHLRPYDLIIRLGGDEFLCVMTDMPADNVRTRFAAVATDLRGGRPPVRITSGFAELGDEDTVDQLIARADADLIANRTRRDGSMSAPPRRGDADPSVITPPPSSADVCSSTEDHSA